MSSRTGTLSRFLSGLALGLASQAFPAVTFQTETPLTLTNTDQLMTVAPSIGHNDGTYNRQLSAAIEISSDVVQIGALDLLVWPKNLPSGSPGAAGPGTTAVLAPASGDPTSLHLSGMNGGSLSCNAGSVTVVRADGGAVAPVTDVIVRLWDGGGMGGGQVSFYSDSGCTTYLPATNTISSGSSTPLSFYWYWTGWPTDGHADDVSNDPYYGGDSHFPTLDSGFEPLS